MRRALLGVVVASLLAACGAEGTRPGPAGIVPRNGRSGLSLSGVVDGRQYAVSDGAPTLRVGDCDVNEGADTDLCFFSRDIDGVFFGIVVENPDVLRAGATVPVVASTCVGGVCDDVTGGAVVDVQLGVGQRRIRAAGGSLTLDTLEVGRRYSGTLTLVLPDGRLAGTYEVVPRPEE
ncbi:MAG: hypothetical protein M3O86_02210 [Actinomycetota bacterium]|nr:hypothetical protein [Actinomycetota bacterium]